MATVTMDINELDKLRQDLKSTEEKLKTSEKELNDVKADKRVMVIKKIAQKGDFTYSIDNGGVEQDRRFGNYKTDEILYRNIIIHPIIPCGKEIPEFRNFEDVKAELRVVLENQYKDELAEARAQQRHADDRRRDLEKDSIEVQKKLVKEHQEQEELLQEQIKEWEKKYKELEIGKKELTRIEELENIIGTLKDQLVAESSKTWWQKLLGK